jgi:hypothetical protein
MTVLKFKTTISEKNLMKMLAWGYKEILQAQTQISGN